MAIVDKEKISNTHHIVELIIPFLGLTERLLCTSVSSCLDFLSGVVGKTYDVCSQEVELVLMPSELFERRFEDA